MNRKKDEPKRVELTPAEIMALQARIERRQLCEADYELLQKTLKFVNWLQGRIVHANISLKKLRGLFGLVGNNKKGLRKKDEMCEQDSDDKHDDDDDGGDGTHGCGNDHCAGDNNAHGSTPDNTKQPSKQSRNNGRIPSSAYENKHVIQIAHASYKIGEYCPLNCGGKLSLYDPGVIITVTGQNNFCVTEYQIEKLRCALCGEIFSATLPQTVTKDKYDAEFKSNLILQKYYNATPFYTLEKYYKMLGLPLPDATQWQLVESVENSIDPIYSLLGNYIAQGNLVHFDDTWLRILAVINENKKSEKDKRGCYVTGFVGSYNDYPIRLFMSGDTHAGNNLSTLLQNRSADLAPIQTMSDALAANMSHGLKVIICNCFAHAVRKFKEIAVYYTSECAVILQALNSAYQHEEVIRKEKLDDSARLIYHQKHTLPILTKLEIWLREQQEKHLIEPNSHLGAAVHYLLRHWSRLLQFCKTPGAPIDNNVCEQLLKLAIRIRKTSYFHKTIHGAKVAAKLMSIIYTCLCNKVNPVAYLTACQKNASAVRGSPELWLPWNYQKNIS